MPTQDEELKIRISARDDTRAGFAAAQNTIKDVFGGRGSLKGYGEFLVGGGIIAGLGFLARAASTAADRLTEVDQAFRRGEVSAFGYTEAIARLVPVFGQGYQAGSAFREMIHSLSVDRIPWLAALTETPDTSLEASQRRFEAAKAIAKAMADQRRSEELLSRGTRLRELAGDVEGEAGISGLRGEAAERARIRLQQQRAMDSAFSLFKDTGLDNVFGRISSGIAKIAADALQEVAGKALLRDVMGAGALRSAALRAMGRDKDADIAELKAQLAEAQFNADTPEERDRIATLFNLRMAIVRARRPEPLGPPPLVELGQGEVGNARAEEFRRGAEMNRNLAEIDKGVKDAVAAVEAILGELRNQNGFNLN